MGFIRDEVGSVTIEERRESLVVHADSARSSEYPYGSLEDIIAALTTVRDDPDGRYSAWKGETT